MWVLSMQLHQLFHLLLVLPCLQGLSATHELAAHCRPGKHPRPRCRVPVVRPGMAGTPALAGWDSMVRLPRCWVQVPARRCHQTYPSLDRQCVLHSRSPLLIHQTQCPIATLIGVRLSPCTLTLLLSAFVLCLSPAFA